MPAIQAVKVLREVGDDDVEQVLGFPLITKAERKFVNIHDFL